MQESMVYDMRLGGALRWPRRLLGWCGLWLEVPRMWPLAWLMAAALTITSLTNIIARLSVTQPTILDIGTTTVYIFRHFLWFIKIYVLLGRRDQIGSVLLICFSAIKAPKILRKQVRTFQNRCDVIMAHLGTHTLLLALFYLPTVLISPFNIGIPRLLAKVRRFVVGVQIFGFNVLYLTLTSLVVNTLEHMGDVMHSLHSPRSSANKLDTAYQQKVSGTLIYVIQMHQRAIELMNGINKTFSFVMLLDFWTGQLILVMLVLHLTNKSSGVDWSQVSSFGVISLIHLVFHFFVCWTATDIIEKSGTKLQWKLWHAGWWTWDRKNMRLLNVISSRTRRELRLRAGPFYSPSMQTFSAMLGLSFSYAVILYQLQDSVVSTEATSLEVVINAVTNVTNR